LVVFVAAEAITDLRDKLTEAVTVAFTDATPPDRERRETGVHEPKHRKSRAKRAVRRKLFSDYLSEARAAYQPGVVVTPAWVRQATGCSRGLSPRLAAALAAEVDQTAGGEYR
jgi:hypothetical protein